MSSPLGPISPGTVAVGSLTQARAHKRRYAAVVSIQDPVCGRNHALKIVRLPGVRSPAHLTLCFEDVDSEEWGLRVATERQIREGLAFAREYAACSLLIHCARGIGRSPALALGVLAERLGPGKEAEAVKSIFSTRPESCPNLVVVQKVDSVLNRAGALVCALEKWESSRPEFAAWRKQRREHVAKFTSAYTKA